MLAACAGHRPYYEVEQVGLVEALPSVVRLADGTTRELDLTTGERLGPVADPAPGDLVLFGELPAPWYALLPSVGSASAPCYFARGDAFWSAGSLYLPDMNLRLRMGEYFPRGSVTDRAEGEPLGVRGVCVDRDGDAISIWRD